jgi:hypothetical protein
VGRRVVILQNSCATIKVANVKVECIVDCFED